MGEIIRLGKIIIRIWPNDHDPPHVEAFWPGMKDWEAKAKFRIDDQRCFWNSGFSAKDIRIIQAAIKARVDKIAEKWREIHEQN